MGQLYEITPFTLLDYPGEMACIVWFAGCNMRCRYCHNPAIVHGKGEKEETELLDFLDKRVGRLTSVVFSGGEATLYPALKELMQKVKAKGFKIKLDTNGTRPEVLRELLEGGLLDFVAMDYKAPTASFEKVTGTSKFEDRIDESLALLIRAASEGMKFEVRTTVHPDLMQEEDINTIIATLEEKNYRGTYYVQNVFSVGEKTIGKVGEPTRSLDRSKISKPTAFDVGYRNFKDEKGE